MAVSANGVNRSFTDEDNGIILFLQQKKGFIPPKQAYSYHKPILSQSFGSIIVERNGGPHRPIITNVEESNTSLTLIDDCFPPTSSLMSERGKVCTTVPT